MAVQGLYAHTRDDKTTNPTFPGQAEVRNGSRQGEERAFSSHLFLGLLMPEPKAPRSTPTTGNILPQGNSKRSKWFNCYLGLFHALLPSRGLCSLQARKAWWHVAWPTTRSRCGSEALSLSSTLTQFGTPLPALPFALIPAAFGQALTNV